MIDVCGILCSVCGIFCSKFHGVRGHSQAFSPLDYWENRTWITWWVEDGTGR